MPRILIADDHAIFRHGLKSLLTESFPSAVIGEADTAQQALELVWKKRWDVVLLDLSMPGRTGLEILAEIKKARPQLRALILSAHAEEQYAVRVIRAGAAGYVNKAKAPREVVEAIKKVLAGGLYITPSLAESLATAISQPFTSLPHEKLSGRELAVLRFIASGKTTKEIGSELALSVQTVCTYRTRLLKKMQLQTNAQLMRYALENKLIE